MNETRTSRLYDWWSWGYDLVFVPLLERRAARALSELRLEPGDRVLDLGVGTGITLDAYPPTVQVVGADLSEGMLRKARRKVRQHGMQNVRLVQADALHPPFAERSFDHVLISHVISVVSDPHRVLDWASRLVRPGGRVVLVNHFHAANPLLALLEKLVNPLCVRLGWRSDLSLAELLEGSSLKLAYQYKLSTLDLWQIVVLTDQPARASEPTLLPPHAEIDAGASSHLRPAVSSG